MTIAPHMLRPVAKSIVTDEFLHWHLVSVKEDGSAATLQIFRNWNEAMKWKADMNRADAERQWQSPVKTTRYIHSVHACWQERCLKIADLL